MQLSRTIFLFSFLLLLSAEAEDVSPLFVGGTYAFPGEFPFLTSLQILSFGTEAHFCGGVIIDPRWILTTANCIMNLPIFGTQQAWAGRHNLALRSEAGEVRVSFSRTFIHPSWRPWMNNDPHDLALVLLTSGLPSSARIRSIQLPEFNQPIPNGPLIYAAWGGIGLGATILQKATLFPISLTECRAAINNLNFNGNLYNDTNFCTGPLTGVYSACTGGFGSPLVHGTSPNEVLVGIASWGVTPCGTVGAPSIVVTRVSAYVDWIKATTGIIFIVLSLAIAAALAAPADLDRETRVVGGVNAFPGEFPYIVSVQWVVLTLSTHVCGGFIISPVWVISAAHCQTEIPTLGRLEMLAGRHNIGIQEASSQVRGISTFILHPDWAPGGVGPDDLVLFLLNSPLTFNDRVRAVRLPQPNVIPTGPATLAGWGSTGSPLPPNILQKLTKPLITLEQCRNAIFSLNLNGDLVDDTNVCTGPLTGGVSACSGDSGGPLVQGAAPNEVVIGVVSWGITPCGSVGAPTGVYKRVSAYNAWIQQNTGIVAGEMKIFIVLSLAIAAALAAPADLDRETRVVGGVNAFPGEFPYIVSVQWVILTLSTHVCGGSIISPVWVISAAHCQTEIPTLGRLDILAGRHNIGIAEASSQLRGISNSIVHPGWVPGGEVGPDDVILFLLNSPLTFNDRVRSVRLPQPDVVPIGIVTVAGWGSTGAPLPPNILQKLTKPLITLQECRNAIINLNLDAEFLDDSFICTGPLSGGVSACSGDSGGPLVQGAAPNEILVGVVSWAFIPCGTVGAPTGGYKRVSAYNAWIQQNTGIVAS
ncbi:CLUMA_CG008395, isoform A [Clunio marinus]|uniref:CLUMA_CG008395, isoform A n=1 Tax=Clunio marinus TaxID=568069 RepID=A0A1J1I3J1_9DIPT|nr:CLUMA_CG008395, isoform A [Clunio marinus]